MSDEPQITRVVFDPQWDKFTIIIVSVTVWLIAVWCCGLWCGPNFELKEDIEVRPRNDTLRTEAVNQQNETNI